MGTEAGVGGLPGRPGNPALAHWDGRGAAGAAGAATAPPYLNDVPPTPGTAGFWSVGMTNPAPLPTTEAHPERLF
ncbi:hypothetical protein [Streptomyces sp. NPDC047525]|uniref:hypothetical protein n=1 Tax=Streptomyces sp. NPDC047525 TaxID=3155264 RepID=UPI0033C91C67